MVAVKKDRLTKDVDRLFISGRICASRPEILHPVMMLIIEFVEIRHDVPSLRDRMRRIRSGQSPNMEKIQYQTRKAQQPSGDPKCKDRALHRKG